MGQGFKAIVVTNPVAQDGGQEWDGSLESDEKWYSVNPH